MSRQWVRGAGAWFWRHKTLLVPSLLAGLVLGFLVAEHVRGRILLARYLRSLRARGEKINARDFKSPPPPGENGAPEVLVATKELNAGVILPNGYPPLILTPSGHAIVGFREEKWVEDKVTNHWEQVAADLEVNQATLNRIRLAMAQPVLDCEFDPSLGPRARFPHLTTPKTLTHWFASSIELGLHEGKPSEILPDLVTEIDLPRMLARDGIVISELVRIAIASMARVDTWEALQADGWTDDDLARIQQVWERQAFLNAMVHALEGERVFAQSSYELMRKSDQETAGIIYGMQEFLGTGELSWWERTLTKSPGGDVAADFLKKQVYCRLWRFAWLDQDQMHYLKYLERLIKLGRDAVREKSLQKLGPLVDVFVLEFQNRGFYNELRYSSVVSVDSLSRVFHRAMRAETERSLVLAAIALKRYALRHGASPPSLAVLVPEFLQSVPVDFMDGEPLRYHPQPDGGFVLYSVGEDGKDDGGGTSLPPGKTNARLIWERKDVVWPAPATAQEVEVYRKEAGKN